MNSIGADLTKHQRPRGSASSAEPLREAAPARAEYSAEPVDGRSARWAAHRQQRRDVLIRTARKAVHRLGPDASMEEIATAAGTSKSVFYRYFGDKAGLQQAVGEVVIGQMQETVLTAAQSATSSRQGLKNMVSAYLHMAQTSPHVYAFVTQNPNQTGPASVRTPDTSPPETEPRRPVMPGLGGTSGALGSFFDAIVAMVTVPLESVDDPLSSAQSVLAHYWPAAAIGLVRTAGELWLSSDSRQRPDADAMAEHITHWLYEGVDPPVAPQQLEGTPDSSTSPPLQNEGR
ncbi:TetR/AcrR family transcriptional regulator [Acaricomes phytoseiuli]|uniref:TetR/AcrR family transcriptional regulator n=1 Tax=Acaricomes phytoseiuli TaxID=291968 RepID=UPI0003724AEF|nr:TetR/AcrR family transcriptional regulator [Acaricomes phytoseiuli]MCW1250295.1 TetR/AcrR family transcriptional regulator [Acaricomes phytoseiuli]